MKTSLVTMLLLLAHIQPAGAVAIPPADLVAAYGCGTSFPGTLTLYTVPNGFSFLLTDIVLTSGFPSQAYLQGRPFDLTESGNTRQRFLFATKSVAASISGVFDQTISFASPIVFHQGNTVQFSVGGGTSTIDWCVAMSGYLVSNAVSSTGDVPAAPGLRLSCSPNPTDAGSRFEFATAEVGAARLDVYDVAGRKIAMLLDGQLPVGWHQVMWDGRDERGRDVPSGVYFPRLTTRNATTASKLVVMR